MKQPENDEEHEDLRRLFDATASDASGPTLTKLAARAGDVPQRASRKSRFLPRWAWGPAFAGMAMALGALLARHGAPRQTAAQYVAVVGSAAPVVAVAIASASTSELHATAPRVTATDEASDNLELLGDSDEGARFDVSGPQSDRDLDAWLAATKELSGGT